MTPFGFHGGIPMTNASLLEYLSQSHVVFWGAIVLLAVLPTGIVTWMSMRTREAELETIRNLAERGYSAEEIERLVRSEKKHDDI